MMLEPAVMDPIIRAALEEDIGPGDITTLATVPEAARAKASIHAKASGVIAGLPVACRVFEILDPDVDLQQRLEDGARVEPGDMLLRVSGRARAILTGERTALNFLQQLSGVATRTSQLVARIAGTRAKLLDTRKTVPGMRLLQKYAVRKGGGANHRAGLYDAFLIKDNHIRCAGGIRAAIAAARRYDPTRRLEIEAETLEQVREALEAGADIILCDNMGPDLLRQAVSLVNGRALIEASGNIGESNIAEIAATGVDFISSGELTHSVRALDLSLEIEEMD